MDAGHCGGAILQGGDQNTAYLRLTDRLLRSKNQSAVLHKNSADRLARTSCFLRLPSFVHVVTKACSVQRGPKPRDGLPGWSQEPCRNAGSGSHSSPRRSPTFGYEKGATRPYIISPMWAGGELALPGIPAASFAAGANSASAPPRGRAGLSAGSRTAVDMLECKRLRGNGQRAKELTGERVEGRAPDQNRSIGNALKVSSVHLRKHDVSLHSEAAFQNQFSRASLFGRMRYCTWATG